MANSKQCEDDMLSYCGSISGETFSSRRRKNTCTLRQHSIDVVAAKLREQVYDLEKQGDCCSIVEDRPRCNTFFHGYRFVVVMLGGFSLGLMLLLRYNITVAILNMVNQTALYIEEHPDRTMEDFIAEGYAPGGEFHWDNEIQHMIMSWYMVAYTLPQMPASKLGIAMGSKWAMPISLALCAIATLFTPTFAYLGWQWVIALRLINGIGASAVLPMMLNLVEHWMPYDEISLGLTCAQLLQGVLTALNPLLAGYLSSYHWSYAFYFPGAVTLAFCLLWLLLVTDRPDENRLISQRELEVICGCSKEPQGHNHNQATQQNKKQAGKANNTNNPKVKPQAKWYDVFRVPSFYAYIFLWCFYCSSYSCFSFILPTYLRQFLKIKVSLNGFYCFIIQSGCILSVLWPHGFMRIFQSKFNLSPTASRRLTHILLCVMTAVTWIYVGLFHDTQLLMLFLNRCFHGSNDIVVTGNLMSNYAKVGLSGIVFSMVNTVGNLSVVFSSTFVGYILDYTGQSVEGWTGIFICLGLAQMLILITFTTLINADPIEFKNRKQNNEKINQQQNEIAAQIQKQEELEEEQSNLESKKSLGTIINNFDKLKDVKTENERKI